MAEIERARRKPTDNLDAYDLYLRALPAINVYTRAGFEEAEGLLRRAVALDPAYADALAALAEYLVRMTVNGWAATWSSSRNNRGRAMLPRTIKGRAVFATTCGSDSPGSTDGR